MKFLLFLHIITSIVYKLSAKEEKECVDRSPYCNSNDCTVRPGYAREYCKKTCGNCVDFCHNSHFVSCRQERKSECDAMLKDYCPLLCGTCRDIKIKKEKQITSKSIQSHNTPTTSTTIFTTSSATTTAIPFISDPSSSMTHQFNRLSKQPNGYVMPPMYPSSDDDYNDIKVFPYETNSIEMPAEPLNIEGEAAGQDEEETEWVHDPTVNSPHYQSSLKNKNSSALKMFPEIPEPMPIVKAPTSMRGYNTYSKNRIYSGNTQPVQPVQQFMGKKRLNVNQPRFGPSVFEHHSQRLMPNFPVNPYNPEMTRNTPPNSDYFYNKNINNYNNNYNNFNRLQRQQLNQPMYPGYDNYEQSYFPSKYGNPAFSPANPISSDHPVDIVDLVSLLGCRDRDPATCSKITEETCLARPGFYLKLCPVKCKNCNGIQCFDSIKVDCAEVRRLGGCKLPTAHEYCPRSCEMCTPPSTISDALPPCKDELDNCSALAESGVCQHPHSRETLRTYCAKSCGHCKSAQYYMNDPQYYNSKNVKKS